MVTAVVEATVVVVVVLVVVVVDSITVDVCVTGVASSLHAELKILAGKVASADGVLRVDEVAWRISRSRFFIPVTVLATIVYTVAVVVTTGCVVVEGTVVNWVCTTELVGVALTYEIAVVVALEVCMIVDVVVETGVL